MYFNHQTFLDNEIEATEEIFKNKDFDVIFFNLSRIFIIDVHDTNIFKSGGFDLFGCCINSDTFLSI